jgi:hypothetical protein
VLVIVPVLETVLVREEVVVAVVVDVTVQERVAVTVVVPVVDFVAEREADTDRDVVAETVIDRVPV